MQPVRELVCQQDNSEGPYAHPHRGETVHVFPVWEGLHPERQSDHPPEDPLWGETLQLLPLWRLVQQPQQPAQTHGHTPRAGRDADTLTPKLTGDQWSFRFFIFHQHSLILVLALSIQFDSIYALLA